MSDDLSLVVNSQTISGWQSIRVTRGIERCPNDFDILMTEHFPSEFIEDVVVRPGDECQVKIGDDLVLTGYVDREMISIDKGSHNLRIIGRGKCQDLVDCVAEWDGNQITGATALDISQKLASPYGITVSSAAFEDKLVQTPIPQVNLILTETAWEIIERTCRYRGMLAYENPDGNLFLSRVGDKKHSSGFSEGVNAQEAQAEYSMDKRYSEYHVYLQSIDTFQDVGTGGNEISVIKDENVRRNRKMSIISEAGMLGSAIAIARGTWERNRREGRSSIITVVADNWRDSEGMLWTPNMLVDLSFPTLKLPDDPTPMLISEVTYNLTLENGTTARIVLMPPLAFSVQPILLVKGLQEFS
jgi:prophage tail gpP-like protein